MTMRLLPRRCRLWCRSAASAVRHWRLARRIRKEALVRERVDRLLARVAQGGVDALSPAERRFLYRASRFFKAPREEKVSPFLAERPR